MHNNAQTRLVNLTIKNHKKEENMKKYIRSDLFEETFFADFGNSHTLTRLPEVENEVFSLYRYRMEKSKKTEESAYPKGSYSTFFSSDIITLSNKESDILTAAVARELRALMWAKAEKLDNVMIIGLGNPYFTSDSLGAKTVEKIILSNENGKKPRVFAFSVGVSSVTGIETAEHIKGLSIVCRPDMILAIDALAARSRKRLYSTVQISDAGITPGAGIGNHRLPINEETVGVPVISIGIPTVISSSTLICDTLKDAGIDRISDGLKAALDEDRDFFVTSGYCDMEIKGASIMLSRAIEAACFENI